MWNNILSYDASYRRKSISKTRGARARFGTTWSTRLTTTRCFYLRWNLYRLTRDVVLSTSNGCNSSGGSKTNGKQIISLSIFRNSYTSRDNEWWTDTLTKSCRIAGAPQEFSKSIHPETWLRIEKFHFIFSIHFYTKNHPLHGYTTISTPPCTEFTFERHVPNFGNTFYE